MVNKDLELIAHPSRVFYAEALAGLKVKLPGLAQAMKTGLPSYEYYFENVKTGRIDDKIVGLAYPGSYGNFQGLGWIVGAGAHSGDLTVDIPHVKRRDELGSLIRAFGGTDREPQGAGPRNT